MTVRLSSVEWVKLLATIVVWTLLVYRFIDGIRDELSARVVVLEEKATTSEQTNQRLIRIEDDIKQLLQRLPR